MSDAVGLGINPPPSGFDMLNSILGIQAKKQQLQSQALQIRTQEAGLVGQQQQAKEIQAVSPLLADPVKSGILDENGNPTQNAQSIIMNVAPTTGATRYDQILTAAKSKLDFNKSANALNSDERGEVSNWGAGAAADPNAKPQDVLNALDAGLATKQGTPEYQHYQTLVNFQKKIISHLADQTSTGPAPATGMEPWRQQGVYAFNRANLGSAGLTGAGGVAGPGGLVTLPSGALGSRNAVSGAVTPSPVGAGGGGTGNAAPTNRLTPLARPSANSPKADWDNYNAQIGAASQDYTTTAAAANEPLNGVQATRYRNQQILALSPNAMLGPGLSVLNAIASRMPGATPGADAYQVIAHNTAANSAAIAGKLGVPRTNLGSETSAAIAGNVERNPQALIEITKQNDALNTGFDLYNRGLAKVTNNGSDMSRAASYKQAFGANMDVNALRWADANRRGDTAEIKELQQEFGNRGIAAFGQKLHTLKSLAENGDLPQ